MFGTTEVKSVRSALLAFHDTAVMRGCDGNPVFPGVTGWSMVEPGAVDRGKWCAVFVSGCGDSIHRQKIRRELLSRRILAVEEGIVSPLVDWCIDEGKFDMKYLLGMCFCRMLASDAMIALDGGAYSVAEQVLAQEVGMLTILDASHTENVQPMSHLGCQTRAVGVFSGSTCSIWEMIKDSNKMADTRVDNYAREFLERVNFWDCIRGYVNSRSNMFDQSIDWVRPRLSILLESLPNSQLARRDCMGPF